MSSFQLLDQREEDELHKSRLLGVEEKPFKRITKRLLTPGSLVSSLLKLPPTPPPDATFTDPAVADAEAFQQKQLDERRQFREDILLDFAAFDSSIARIQFLHNSNARERDRYAAEKLRIQSAAQDVKDNTALLRVQLDAARATLNQRKEFDKLAEKITSNRMLRTREEQAANLLKLEEECRELERERELYGEIWKERREQFGRIVEEGVRLRRLIRDEKEEVERREGMAEEEDGEVGDAASRGGATPKHSSLSGGATPRPDGSATPAARRGSPEPQGGNHSKLKPLPGGYSRSGSRAPSPAGYERRKEEGDGGDAVMADAPVDSPMAGASSDAEEGEEVEVPQVTVREPSASGSVNGRDQASTEDKMDMT